MVTINSPSEENNQQKVCNSSFSSERVRKRNIMVGKQRREDWNWRCVEDAAALHVRISIVVPGKGLSAAVGIIVEQRNQAEKVRKKLGEEEGDEKVRGQI